MLLILYFQNTKKTATLKSIYIFTYHDYFIFFLRKTSFSHLSIFQVHIDNKQIRKQITSTNILMFKQNETIK